MVSFILKCHWQYTLDIVFLLLQSYSLYLYNLIFHRFFTLFHQAHEKNIFCSFYAPRTENCGENLKYLHKMQFSVLKFHPYIYYLATYFNVLPTKAGVCHENCSMSKLYTKFAPEKCTKHCSYINRKNKKRDETFFKLH